MALGHPDTERFYRQLLAPVLKRNGIVPLVITAQESNDDLNNQIIEQLNICDLCVADLTYARQSVYFEAGYAQRAVPVIYTVRKDHFDRSQPDDRRVHFDLLMKSIVPWKGPGDLSFRTKFERRLRATFLREWNRKAQTDEKLDEERKAFGAASVRDRVKVVRRVAIKVMRSEGFSIGVLEAAYAELETDIEKLVNSSRPLYGLRRTVGENAVVVLVQAVDAVRKKELQQFALQGPFLTRLDSAFLRKANAVVTNLYVLSLQSVTDSRIASLLPSFVPDEIPGGFSHEEMGADPRKDVRYRITLDCFSGIRSERELRVALLGRLQRRQNEEAPASSDGTSSS